MLLDRVFETTPEARDADSLPSSEAPALLRALGTGYLAVGATAELARDLAVSLRQLPLAAKIDREIVQVLAGQQPLPDS